ncbi:MAG: secondary thiamine-phosphate synthase enzyme YjbQ [Candidatus Ornithospirochaeta sp.]
MFKKFNIETKFNDVINITEDVKNCVKESGVQEGICVVYNPHTTASLAVTSFWDPAGFEDLQDEICRLIPTKVDFKHQHDTPQDAAGHVKSAIVGISQTFIIHEGKLVLGGSQGIFFLEFDGPRKRQFIVKVAEG